uniref:Uncharacterized protein n=1 Tax=Arundo donax TaxID=35708 RepID=A0A0A9DEI1_ARUDO
MKMCDLTADFYMLSGIHSISSSSSPDSVCCSFSDTLCFTLPPATTTALSLTSALSPDLSHRPICMSPSSSGSPNAAAALIIVCRSISASPMRSSLDTMSWSNTCCSHCHI